MMRLRVYLERMCFIGVVLTFPASMALGHGYESVSICNALKKPGAYAGKKVSFHGLVVFGMESASISDEACFNRGIELDVDKDVHENSDILEFHRKIAHWKMRGFATVAGTFTVDHGALTPYVLHVEKVWNVTKNGK